MGWQEVVQRPTSRWMEAGGPESRVVVSSRVRLARNLKGWPYPWRATAEQLQQVLERVEQAVRSLEDSSRYFFIPLISLVPLDLQLLVEKHLTSPQHIQEIPQRALVLRDDEGIAMLVNEEDHLRLQCFLPGLQLEQAWEESWQLEQELEQHLEFAYDPGHGYLTACPTNVGTGMRASVMVHLPGLAMLEQLGEVFATLGKLGLAARGMYGEGSRARGNLFQLSNQITLGPGEEELVSNLHAVTLKLVKKEEQARQQLYEKLGDRLVDRIYRSYGILSQARLLSSQETINLISDLKLGVDLNLLDHLNHQTLNELLLLSQPGFLQKISGSEQDPVKRDARRATLIRGRLQDQTC